MSIEKYGRRFETNSLLDVELYAFRERLTVEQGGLGPAVHFENLVRELWPWYVWEDDFGPLESPQEQAEALCSEEVVGFTSGASGLKSDILAKWGICNWFADPINTLVIVVSTSAKDAAQRIWGYIVRDWRFCRRNHKSVGKLIESMSIIKLSEGTDGIAASDNSSICLIAAGGEFANDALKRLEGKKNRRVFLILDELQDCSDTVVNEAIWNLNVNPYFHVAAAGNASKRIDPHGQFLAPVGGWPTINTTTHKWRIKVGTKEGVGIHFDGENSPNVKRFMAGKPQLPFMRRAEEYFAAKKTLGEENAQFLRQFRGFWSMSDGEANYILTDAVLAANQCYDKPVWKSPPVDILGIDPSYSDSGDRFVAHHCAWGMSSHGVWTFAFIEAYIIKPKLIPGETRDDGNIRECKRLAADLKISPRNIGIDASAGSPILSIVHRTWSTDILAVQFGGSASDLPISFHDKRLASDCYANATSELAYVLVEFVQAGQVRGVKPDLAKELTARQFEISAGNKVKIEKKADVKKRLGFSPDLWDSGSVALMVLRTRLKVQAGAAGKTDQAKDWKAAAKKGAVATRSEQVRQLAFGRLT